MGLKVTVNEKCRVFNVTIGCNNIGKVTSYFEEGEDNSEVYHAERIDNDNDSDSDDEDYAHVSWCSSLKEAALAVVEYDHGEGRIDKVTERKV